jgi:hypothetical protein
LAWWMANGKSSVPVADSECAESNAQSHGDCLKAVIPGIALRHA